MEAAKTEMERFKVQAELIEATLKYKAEVDVAEAQAAAKMMESAFASVNVGIQSTGETISNLTETLLKAESIRDRWTIEETLRSEMEFRQQEFALQSALTKSTIEYNQARTESLERGDAAISITCDGIYPELEMLLWKVVERVQIRANANAQEFLLGI